MISYKEVAAKYGVEHIGCTSAKRYNEKSGESFKTAMVALFPYFTGEDEKSNLSKYCQSEDYHKVCARILDKICRECNFKDYKIFCDTGYHIDRALAFDAGLGFYGKNSMLINDKLGSYFFIAYALLNERLETHAPLEKSCIGCDSCVKKCPNGAILNSGKICEERCVSSITQKKGGLTHKEEELIKTGGLVFGCDVCQDVCPHNRNLSCTKIADFLSERINVLTLSDIESLSNREFKEKYAKYAFSWRGKKVLERNLKILGK